MSNIIVLVSCFFFPCNKVLFWVGLILNWSMLTAYSSLHVSSARHAHIFISQLQNVSTTAFFTNSWTLTRMTGSCRGQPYECVLTYFRIWNGTHVVWRVLPLPLPFPLIPSPSSTPSPSPVYMCVSACTSQVRTRDLGGYSTTGDFVRAVVENLRHRPAY